MDSHSQIRFSETPPDSPKSCMKGSRRLTFEESTDMAEPATSPKRGVRIRSPETGASTSTAATNTPPAPVPPAKKPTDIQFEFNLTQHFDQSTPPPNCTSNGDAHEFEEPTQTEDDPRKDPQLAEIASKFVNEIIEKAKIEVANREKAEQSGKRIPQDTERGNSHADFFAGGGRTPWYRRAHGAISKWVTNLCVRAQNSLRT